MKSGFVIFEFDGLELAAEAALPSMAMTGGTAGRAAVSSAARSEAILSSASLAVVVTDVDIFAGTGAVVEIFDGDSEADASVVDERPSLESVVGRRRRGRSPRLPMKLP